MAGVVQGGSLGRWFEEVCRIKHETLDELVVAISGNRYRRRPRSLPSQGGVYAFWWTGAREIFQTKAFNRAVNLHGPGGRTVKLSVDEEWLGLDADLPVPLYVGKNADDIGGRIGQHLRLGSPERMIPMKVGAKRHKAPTTSCQLRAGVEHHFPAVEAPIDFILANVGLSYVILDGDKNAANRFYLEDLAVGLMRPPINVDVER